MKSIPEVCRLLNITEDQLYRRYKAYEIEPQKVKNVTVFTDEEVEKLKGTPNYMSAESLALLLGVEKKKLVLSKDIIMPNGKPLYNVEKTKALTPLPEADKLTMTALRARFHMPAYRIYPAIPSSMKQIAKRNNGVYPDEIINILKDHFSNFATVSELSREFFFSRKEIERIIDEEWIVPAYEVKGIKIYSITEVTKALNKIEQIDHDRSTKRIKKAMAKQINDP